MNKCQPTCHVTVAGQGAVIVGFSLRLRPHYFHNGARGNGTDTADLTFSNPNNALFQQRNPLEKPAS